MAAIYPMPLTEEELDLFLSRPTEELREFMKKLPGDILILGIGGKIGVTLGMAAVRVCREGGITKTIYGVSRFSDPRAQEKLEQIGVKTIPCDLLDRRAIDNLPRLPTSSLWQGRNSVQKERRKLPGH
jgi:hypothetical protein